MRALPDILTEDEEQALLATFNRRYPTAERNRLMIWLALTTGMRVGDLINLKFGDIELDTGRTHIKLGKGAKDRVLFIRAEILSDLVDLADRISDHTGLVFTTLKGGSLQPSYLRGMIQKQARKAGIEKRVHFHLLRHTYLTRLYGRTKDIRVVQEVAGHASIATTQIYTHVSGEDIREAMLGPAPESAAKATKADVKHTLEKAGRAAAASKKKLNLDSEVEPDPEEAEAVAEMINQGLRNIHAKGSR